MRQSSALSSPSAQSATETRDACLFSDLITPGARDRAHPTLEQHCIHLPAPSKHLQSDVTAAEITGFDGAAVTVLVLNLALNGSVDPSLWKITGSTPWENCLPVDLTDPCGLCDAAVSTTFNSLPTVVHSKARSVSMAVIQNLIYGSPLTNRIKTD